MRATTSRNRCSLPFLCSSTYTILSGTHLLCTLIYGGYDTLALVSLPNGTLTRLDTPYVQVSKLRAISSTRVVFYGVRNDAPPAVILLDLTPALKNGATKLEGVEIKRSSDVIADGTVGKEWISVAEQVEFPTELPVCASTFSFRPAFILLTSTTATRRMEVRPQRMHCFTLPATRISLRQKAPLHRASSPSTEVPPPQLLQA